MLPPGITLFSWAPGDTLVVTIPPTVAPSSARTQAHEDEHESRREWKLGEVRMHRPWGLWRHRQGIQLPFHVFFGEAQSVWSQATSRAAAGGMLDSSLEERRSSLPAEVHEYKELYFQLMRRVARFTEELSSIPANTPEEEAKLRADAEEFQSLCELLYRGHQAWHLAHIVIKHLVPLPPSSFADLPFDLVHWIQEHDPLDLYLDVKRQTRISPFLPDGSPNADWWTMLYRFVMHVWVDQANDMLQELLDEHAARLGDDGRNLVESVVALLDGLLDLEDTADLQMRVDAKWRVWSQAQEWRIADQLVSRKVPLHGEVGTLLNILRGNVDVIGAYAKTWSQCVVAQMMFRRNDNVLGVADLANVVEDVLVQWGEMDQGKTDYEGVIKALMRLDVQQAVQAFSESLTDWWSAAHLADVLYRGNFLPFSQQFASDMRAFSIRNYLSLLLANNRMWQVAVGYVRGAVECDIMTDDVGSVGGRARWQQRKAEMLHLLADIVSRQSMDWDKAHRRLLQACPENIIGTTFDSRSRVSTLQPLWAPHELVSIGGGLSNSVHVAWGVKLLAKGREAAALHWLSRGQSPRVREVAHARLLAFVSSSQSSDLKQMEPLLKYLDDSAQELEGAHWGSKGGRVVKLVRDFCQLRQLIQNISAMQSSDLRKRDQDMDLEKESVRAAELLRSMLHPSTAAPKQFWPELLAYTVPLMEGCPTAVFSSADIFLFLQALQDINESRNARDVSQGESGELRMQATRLALARGLALAYQHERSGGVAGMAAY